jgi:regulator of ribonuclease activity A
VTSTADLLDEHGADALVCLLQLRSYGAPSFAGPVATVRCLEDNVLLKQAVSGPGGGRVLVVDGGGSLRCALLGDSIAALAKDNGWAGIVLNACVRDSVALDELGLGVKALGTNPRPSRKGGDGEVGVPVTFGEVTFVPGAMLHADEDGVVVLPGEAR